VLNESNFGQLGKIMLLAILHLTVAFPRGLAQIGALIDELSVG
jgi:hypothetical protein